MSLQGELGRALATATANARAALAESKQSGDEMRAARAEIALLRIEVSTLTQLVTALAAHVVDGGGGTPTQFGKHLVAIASPIEIDMRPDDTEQIVLETAYRGATPGDSSRCARCGAPLADDEPEMSLGAGRVCSSCFARA